MECIAELLIQPERRHEIKCFLILATWGMFIFIPIRSGLNNLQQLLGM